jgi:hypothetical protein
MSEYDEFRDKALGNWATGGKGYGFASPGGRFLTSLEDTDSPGPAGPPQDPLQTPSKAPMAPSEVHPYLLAN